MHVCEGRGGTGAHPKKSVLKERRTDPETGNRARAKKGTDDGARAPGFPPSPPKK